MYTKISGLKDFWRELGKSAKLAKQHAVEINETVKLIQKSDKELNQIVKKSRTL